MVHVMPFVISATDLKYAFYLSCFFLQFVMSVFSGPILISSQNGKFHQEVSGGALQLYSFAEQGRDHRCEISGGYEI